MKKMILMALLCGFASQTNCLLTEKLAVTNSQVVTIKADINAGKTVTVKVGDCKADCRNCRMSC